MRLSPLLHPRRAEQVRLYGGVHQKVSYPFTLAESDTDQPQLDEYASLHSRVRRTVESCLANSPPRNTAKKVASNWKFNESPSP